jgi:predicted MFS family arabinose efflux permease
VRKPFPTFVCKPNSLLALFFLATIGTAGIYYVNIIPALVGTLVDSLGFTKQQAGYVSSANMYGAACGAILAVFMVKRVYWKKIVGSMLLTVIVIDLVSPLFTSPEPLMIVRFVAGTVGGVATGTIMAIIARTSQPSRGYGFLLVMQFGLGGVGLLILPSLVATLGHQTLFYALACVSIAAVLMLPYLSEYPIENKQSSHVHTSAFFSWNSGAAIKPLLLVVAAIALFQSANMGLFAYLERLGMHEQHGMQWVSFSLAAGSWVGIPGSALVILLSTRFGRLRPLAIGLSIILGVIWLFHFSANDQVYFWANVFFASAWAFCLPYMFGMCAELDLSGQMAAVGGLASKFGMATGPLVSATILTGNNYALLINVAFITMIVAAVIACATARAMDKKERMHS